MKIPKEELVKMIETTRIKLNTSIDSGEEYARVYEQSVELDRLLEQYITSGY